MDRYFTERMPHSTGSGDTFSSNTGTFGLYDTARDRRKPVATFEPDEAELAFRVAALLNAN